MDRKSLHRKIFVGPMTKNVVDEVKYFNKNQKNFFGIIPSRRQIECERLGGGYVNNWTTEKFTKYVSEEANGLESLESDIKSGITFLHIDPWKSVSSFEAGVKRTKDLIEHCLLVNKDCYFEVGTEEAIFPYSPKELGQMLADLEKGLGDNFSKIVYGVVQSGTSILGMKNTGNFSKEKSAEMSRVCHSYGLYSKEHNSDYLSSNEIRMRLNAGVDSLNIAPELGVLETKAIMEILSEREVLRERFIKICYDSGKWRKWVSEEPKKEVVAEICGHYVFGSKEFDQIKQKLNEDFEVDNLVCSKIRKKLNEIYQIAG